MGEIPAWLGGLPLKAIHLRKNNFTGVIPESPCNLSSLQEINFARNKLEGTIPEGLGGLMLWWARHMRGARLESRAEQQCPAWPICWPHSLSN